MIKRGRLGRDYVRKLNRLSVGREHLKPLPAVLLLAADPLRCALVTAVFRSVVGYDAELRTAGSLGDSLDSVAHRQPGLIVIDDVTAQPDLAPKGLAMMALPILRRYGFERPIIVVATLLTRGREQQLIEEGAVDVIDRDDLSAARFGEALEFALRHGRPAVPRLVAAE